MAKGFSVKFDNVKYVPNKSFPSQLMNSSPVMAIIEGKRRKVEAAANASAVKAGAKYSGDTQKGRKRCHGIVHTGNFVAMLDNFKNDTLVKALRK